MKLPVLVVMVGNIGSGKTTLAKKIVLKKNYFHMELDNLIQISSTESNTFTEDLNDAFSNQFYDLVDKQKSIIIDGNFMSVNSRIIQCKYAKSKGFKVICYDFGKGDLKQLNRRINSSPYKSKHEWSEIFKNKQLEYEEPTFMEPFDKIIKKR